MLCTMLRVKRHRSGGIRRAGSARPPCAHKRQKFPRQVGKRQGSWVQVPPGYNNNVQTLGDAALVQAENLPHHTLDPVAPHRITAFSRYRKPKTPLTGQRAVIQHKKNKMPRKIALSRTVTFEKIRPPQKAVCTGKQ